MSARPTGTAPVLASCVIKQPCVARVRGQTVDRNRETHQRRAVKDQINADDHSDFVRRQSPSLTSITAELGHRLNLESQQ
jgi:hypothetical protein